MRKRTLETAPKKDSLRHRFALLLPLVALCSCASPAPYATSIGILQPGATMHVRITRGDLRAYEPIIGGPQNRFTIRATALDANAPPPAPLVRAIGNGIDVTAPDPLRSLLVRVPQSVNLAVDSTFGNVSVTNIPGNVTVKAGAGNVHIMLSGYAQVALGKGPMSVTMGSTTWPGLLKFTDGDGDVEVWVEQIAKFHVRLHTDDGTLFTDFPLRGHSHGPSETIDANVNGGASRSIDIEVKRGTIRLLGMKPAF